MDPSLVELIDMYRKVKNGEARHKQFKNLLTQSYGCLPIHGFSQRGNSCHFNSLIQAIISLRTFILFIVLNPNKITTPIFKTIKGYFSRAILTQTPLENEAALIYRKLVEANLSIPIPYDQQDSGEMLLFLIDIAKLEPVFEHHYKKYSRCSVCDHIDVLNESIPGVIIFLNRENPSIITSLISDPVPSTDKCKNCDNKSLLLYLILQPPENVIIFQFSDLTYQQKKLPEHITIRGVNMKLTAAIIYYSAGAYGGHYICQVNRNDEWYSINDNNIKKISYHTIDWDRAYLVFYERIL
uniref:USP domain-containing protein n=1 Tax=Abalone asfa-like virus TaxID=2839893 RepID=A0A5K7XYJ8_9VIRU|nr:hypothetical protein [Abalone asfa-like virus]BCY04580.1 hypothetical protein [Abalone asfa-like virus]